jgi:uncharacterized protein with HEPN domain
MFPRDWRVRIQDIIDAAREILSFMSNMDFENFPPI